MEPIVEMIDAAEREVLAHTIESTRGLRAFFCQHRGEELMSSLQEEAVRRGLYRYMGQRYAEAVEVLLHRTRQCIAFGRIRTENELRLYLVDLAGSLGRYSDRALAINDLPIRARQTGLYSFLASTAAENQPYHASPHEGDPAMQDRIRSGIEA